MTRPHIPTLRAAYFEQAACEVEPRGMDHMAAVYRHRADEYRDMSGRDLTLMARRRQREHPMTLKLVFAFAVWIAGLLAVCIAIGAAFGV